MAVAVAALVQTAVGSAAATKRKPSTTQAEPSSDEDSHREETSLSSKAKPGAASAEAAKAAWAIGIGPALYTDKFERTTQDSNSIGGPQAPQRDEYGTSTVVNGSVWLLHRLVPDVRVGGVLRWYGEYAGVDDGNDTTFGQLFDLAAHGEYLIDAVWRDFGVLFGARLGGTVLFPSGPGLDDDPNIDGPRFGFFGEPLIGVRWVLLPKLALRADTGVKFGRIYLYDTGQTIGDVRTSTYSHLDHFQVQWGFGLEFMP